MSEPNIIIISVKEIEYSDNKPEEVASSKWQRKAVDESARQIYKAERWITSHGPMQTRSKEPILIPDLKNWRIHRIAVALGSKGKTTIGSADFGRGFVHVCDERSIYALTRELDTITDFVDYLTAVEELTSKHFIILEKGEEDLLAAYLYYGRKFPDGPIGSIMIPKGNWDNFNNLKEVKIRRELERISQLWDNMIETFSHDLKAGTLFESSTPNETELVLRTMAKGSRFNRRLLSAQISDVIKSTPKTDGRARMMQSPSGVAYLFMLSPGAVSREVRREHLFGRCMVVRDLVPCETVIGIATEHSDPNKPGFSLDACYVHYAQWTDQLHEQAQKIQEALGYFVNPTKGAVHVDEYSTDPSIPGDPSYVSDPSTARFEFLKTKYPVTLEKTLEFDGLNAIGNQLGTEGYATWQILGGVCSLIMNFRVDQEAGINRSDTNAIETFVENYDETPFSPFPSFDTITLKEVRERIRLNLSPLIFPKSIETTHEGLEPNQTEREPRNYMYMRTQDDFDLWIVFFPDYRRQPGTISLSDEWRLRIGCDSKDSTSFEISRDLSRDLAMYAGIIDWWLGHIGSPRKTELSISIIEEQILKQRFHSSYERALKGRQEIGDSALIMGWRDLQDIPHLKIGVNKEISQQPRMARLSYCLSGILQCICGADEDEALTEATVFVETLE